MICDVGGFLSFSPISVGCGLNGLLLGISGFDVVVLRRDSRNLRSWFDRTVGRRETWSRVVNRAQAQQAVDLVQAALSAMYLPLSAVDVFMSILNTLAKLFGLLARERDGGVVCRHVLVHVVLEADRVLI